MTRQLGDALSASGRPLPASGTPLRGVPARPQPDQRRGPQRACALGWQGERGSRKRWPCHTALAVLLTVAGCSSTATRVITYAPTKVPANAQRAPGSCWTHSISAPGRADAWRCAVANQIEDPCFELAGSPYLLCNSFPAAPSRSQPVLIELTLPLPPQPRDAITAPQPWLIELSTGAFCRPFTGIRPPRPNGTLTTYACSDRSTVFGSLHRARQWTAQVASQPGQALHTVTLRAVWQ